MTEPTHYLYKIQPTRLEMLTQGPTAAEEDIIGQHFAYLKDLTGQGIVLLAGRTLTADENSFGIIIFKANSAEAAHHIMTNDPAVKQGVMRAELYPYRVALLGRE